MNETLKALLIYDIGGSVLAFILVKACLILHIKKEIRKDIKEGRINSEEGVKCFKEFKRSISIYHVIRRGLRDK